MIRFKLLSGKVYEVTVTEWLIMDKEIRKLATLIID